MAQRVPKSYIYNKTVYGTRPEDNEYNDNITDMKKIELNNITIYRNVMQ